MDLVLLGWPEDGPTLSLDHREFSYAGKFVMSSTGKAVGREDGEVVAAAAFSEDRTDPATLWIRYVTVRRDRRGGGLGPRLAGFVVDRARARGYERVRIAVNNPYAYEALYRAGFEFTGEQTGLAELVLEWPGDGGRKTGEREPDEPNTGEREPHEPNTGEREPHEPDPEAYLAGIGVFEDRDLSADERAFLRRRREQGLPAVGQAVPDE